jgi:hypothetical protein
MAPATNPATKAEQYFRNTRTKNSVTILWLFGAQAFRNSREEVGCVVITLIFKNIKLMIDHRSYPRPENIEPSPFDFI